jgi:hypothetical protein
MVASSLNPQEACQADCKTYPGGSDVALAPYGEHLNPIRAVKLLR